MQWQSRGQSRGQDTCHGHQIWPECNSCCRVAYQSIYLRVMRNYQWSCLTLSLILLLAVPGSSPAYISQLEPLRPPHFLPAKHLAYRSPLVGVGGYNGGSELEKHNCTLQEVEEVGHICTPDILTSCDHMVARSARVSTQYSCFNISATVCTVMDRLVDQSVCRYHYQYRLEEAGVEGVEVSYQKECRDQSVTVCNPHNLEHLQHQHCRDISQQTCQLQPRVKRRHEVVEVRYPEPVLTCGDLSLRLPTIKCQVVVRETCVSQPAFHHTDQTLTTCVRQVQAGGAAGGSCRRARLSLPTQTCSELDFGREL